MTNTEYPKMLKAITNGKQFLTIGDTWDVAAMAVLFNVEQIAEDVAKRAGGTVVDFQVIGWNDVTMARIVRDPFTGKVSEA